MNTLLTTAHVPFRPALVVALLGRRKARGAQSRPRAVDASTEIDELRASSLRSCDGHPPVAPPARFGRTVSPRPLETRAQAALQRQDTLMPSTVLPQAKPPVAAGPSAGRDAPKQQAAATRARVNGARERHAAARVMEPGRAAFEAACPPVPREARREACKAPKKTSEPGAAIKAPKKKAALVGAIKARFPAMVTHFVANGVSCSFWSPDRCPRSSRRCYS